MYNIFLLRKLLIIISQICFGYLARILYKFEYNFSFSQTLMTKSISEFKSRIIFQITPIVLLDYSIHIALNYIPN